MAQTFYFTIIKVNRTSCEFNLDSRLPAQAGLRGMTDKCNLIVVFIGYFVKKPKCQFSSKKHFKITLGFGVLEF